MRLIALLSMALVSPSALADGPASAGFQTTIDGQEVFVLNADCRTEGDGNDQARVCSALPVEEGGLSTEVVQVRCAVDSAGWISCAAAAPPTTDGE